MIHFFVRELPGSHFDQKVLRSVAAWLFIVQIRHHQDQEVVEWPCNLFRFNLTAWQPSTPKLDGLPPHPR